MYHKTTNTEYSAQAVVECKEALNAEKLEHKRTEANFLIGFSLIAAVLCTMLILIHTSPERK